MIAAAFWNWRATSARIGQRAIMPIDRSRIRIISALLGAKPFTPPPETMHVHITLFSHIRGLALNLEAEAQAEQDTGLTSDEWMQTQEPGFREIADAGDFPLLDRLVDSDLDMDLDPLFEFGLRLLLDGLERHLGDRRPT